MIPANRQSKPPAASCAKRSASIRLGWTSLRGFYVAPGFADEFLHGFIARDCTESPLEADEDEELIVEWKPLGEAIDLVESGEIIDAKSVILIQYLALEAVGPLGRKIVRHYRGQE